MNLRKYGWLFWTTLVVGGIGGLLGGFLVAREELLAGTVGNFFIGMLVNLLVGLTISVLAQMGFFAYMTLNYLMLSFLRSNNLWKGIQIFLILFAAFDMVYLRYSFYGGELGQYIVEPLLLLFVSIVAGIAKVKLTNGSAFVPTVFFLFVVTAVEWVPALQQNNIRSILFMVIPLLFCNVWQVMQLHRLVKQES
ncbi:KinB-signaling pathway activation protein [Brevibacillus sp. B_LB10_24]|uniref:KinB-signaling pathway activation protein n=1 Tax=Brevibacillus sp. B_LB10_24 TaxID=3380645 RepID=UPI0038BBBCD9